jgi:hypothetical protein
MFFDPNMAEKVNVTNPIVAYLSEYPVSQDLTQKIDPTNKDAFDQFKKRIDSIRNVMNDFQALQNFMVVF